MQLQLIQFSQADGLSKEGLPYSLAALRQDLERVRSIWDDCQAEGPERDLWVPDRRVWPGGVLHFYKPVRRLRPHKRAYACAGTIGERNIRIAQNAM
jgi:hypothetical protein